MLEEVSILNFNTKFYFFEFDFTLWIQTPFYLVLKCSHYRYPFQGSLLEFYTGWLSYAWETFYLEISISISIPCFAFCEFDFISWIQRPFCLLFKLSHYHYHYPFQGSLFEFYTGGLSYASESFYLEISISISIPTFTFWIWFYLFNVNCNSLERNLQFLFEISLPLLQLWTSFLLLNEIYSIVILITFSILVYYRMLEKVSTLKFQFRYLVLLFWICFYLFMRIYNQLKRKFAIFLWNFTTYITICTSFLIWVDYNLLDKYFSLVSFSQNYDNLYLAVKI